MLIRRVKIVRVAVFIARRVLRFYLLSIKKRNDMKKYFTKEKLSEYSPVLVGLLLMIILLVIPTGHEGAVIYKGAERTTARVLSVNNDSVVDAGLIRTSDQICTLEVEDGTYKGRIVEGQNPLVGSMEKDKFFKEGDRALIYISFKGDEIVSVSMIDHYRLDLAAILVFAFIAVLVAFAGKAGVRAVLAFIVTILAIWKLLVPMYLAGYDPIISGLIITMLISVVVISLVYGFDKRTAAAIAGVGTGLALTCILGIIFTKMFKIHGAIMPNSEGLLYSGFENLDLTRIYMASIFIGASGAIIDVAVDVTAAMREVLEKRPDISRKELIKSGFVIGKANMCTMTTTLLLAYSGGYVSLMMVFMAQGTPIMNILNYKYIASEIIDTIVGSFGLVMVSPLTAVIAGFLFVKSNKSADENINPSF